MAARHDLRHRVAAKACSDVLTTLGGKGSLRDRLLASVAILDALPSVTLPLDLGAAWAPLRSRILAAVERDDEPETLWGLHDEVHALAWSNIAVPRVRPRSKKLGSRGAPRTTPI